MTGLVFNIQRFCIHDGPGIRTVVFFKGCSLRCFWCHNPESFAHKPQVQFFSGKCINCGKCMKCCPAGAHRNSGTGRIFRRDKCIACGNCAENCNAGALIVTGKEIDSEEILREILRDKQFYGNTRGGVTFSGGEPLLQGAFLKELLVKCKEKGLHTAVESALNVTWETVNNVLPYVDLFIADIKVMDEAKHKEVTGCSNSMIISNLKKLVSEKAGTRIWIRIPVVQGVNDSLDAMREIICFLKDMKGVENIELMPYHGIAEGKYESLGMEYAAGSLKPPDDEFIMKAKEIFEGHGLKVK